MIRAGLLAAALLAAVPAMAGAASLPPGDELQRLAAKARERGTVRVLAELDVPMRPAAALDEAQATTLRDAIAVSKGSLERALAGTGWRTTRTFQTVPFVALEVSPEALEVLGRTGVARRVSEDRLEKALLAASVPQIEADLAWNEGYDGTGWVVAVLDTGVAREHPFLAGKVVHEACFSTEGSCPNGGFAQIGTGAAAACSYAPLTCWHGTHVAGIASGRGTSFSGTARGAGIIAIQVFSRFTGASCDDDIEDPCAKSYVSDQVAALEHVFTLRKKMRIAAVNFSLGGGGYTSEQACDAAEGARKAAIDNLRAAGIATVAAAGNDGRPNALVAPACISSAFAVGAVSKSDGVAGFSDSAPFLDFLAPGRLIRSSVPPNGFDLSSGTSMAAPHVAGAFAILSQRLGRANVDAVAEALRSTGVPIEDPRNGVVTPRIAVRAALDTLPAYRCRGRIATLVGTDGPDHLVGAAGPDVIVGLGGDDVIEGRRGDDVLCGGPGNDTLIGGPGDDLLAGGRGDDVLQGNKGADVLMGNAGNDVCKGGAGSDRANASCETVTSVP